jgi:hypothetical protein
LPAVELVVLFTTRIVVVDCVVVDRLLRRVVGSSS